MRARYRRTARLTTTRRASSTAHSIGATTVRRRCRGATRSSTSCTSRASRSCIRWFRERERGTYLGLAHPEVIAHLKHLGVTAVELLPVQAFVPEQFLVERGLVNYWGYNPLAWFAPAPQYAIDDAVAEFKTMVKALHAAGIEVILDVVFNHTAEGNETGPTLSLRGLDNAAYYKLEPKSLAQLRQSHRHRQHDRDRPRRGARPGHRLHALLGRGNARRRLPLRPGAPCSGATTAASAPTRRSSRRWPPSLSLRYVKLIAEPWDIGVEGYQLSHFPAGWSEWNDLYRDTHARLLARQPGHPRQLRRALRRLERPVPRQRPAADREHQLRRLSRRLHAVRRDRVQREAQRGESRRQPRRPQPQPELELRRRRSDRRSGGGRAARAPGPQPARDAAAVAGRADAAGGRRVRPHAAAATTTRTARTTRSAGSTGISRSARSLAGGVRPATAHAAQARAGPAPRHLPEGRAPGRSRAQGRELASSARPRDERGATGTTRTRARSAC